MASTTTSTTTASASTSTGMTDSTQWMCVNEESLFLHDGLIRITDLVQLPRDVSTSSEADRENEVVSFDTKDPAELSERLLSVCGTNTNAYAYSRLLEYRLNALNGLWNSHRQLNANIEQIEKEATSHEESIALLKKQGLWQQPEQVSFSSRVGLLLVFPLLKSQKKHDAELCGETATLLLNCLRDCPPLSLTKEPGDCLQGLESLLCSWLTEGSRQLESDKEESVKTQQNLAAALVALACARGSTSTIIHTIHLIQQLHAGLDSLPVADILHKLLRLEGGPGCTSSLLGSKHMVCWGFEDMLSEEVKEGEEKDKEKDTTDIGRSLTCDDQYLYTTSSHGKGLAKFGSGLGGTLRGFIYAKRHDLGQGWVAHGENHLVHRTIEADGQVDHLCTVLNPRTLKTISQIEIPVELRTTANSRVTVSFLSDGTYYYWLWCLVGADRSGKGQSIFMDVLKIKTNGDIIEAEPIRSRVILQRKDESLKVISDPLLARLRTFKYAATLAMVAGQNTTGGGTAKEDSSTTSCGLTLKLLRKTPIYTCGNSVVMLTASPGNNNNSSSRSIFNGGSTALGTNLCFSAKDGNFTTRVDFVDAPTCSVARGAPIVGLGVCYDASNNFIWTCSNDWVDQWHNPGLRAPHHVCRRLGMEPILKPVPEDLLISIPELLTMLLYHVGSNCCHRVHSDLLKSSLSVMLMRQRSLDGVHLRRVCDILGKALSEGDQSAAQCMFIVLQVMFKCHTFHYSTKVDAACLKHAGSLAWQVLVSTDDQPECGGLQREACNAIVAGLTILYPTEEEQNSLMHDLLLKREGNPALGRLCDLILGVMGQMLRMEVEENGLSGKLNDELVHLILQISMKEACKLLQSCSQVSWEEFESIISTVPLASPSSQYMMALEVKLLRDGTLCNPNPVDGTTPSKVDSDLADLQQAVLNLASKVFSGCAEVLQCLVRVCQDFTNSDRECWLQGLERLVKGTMLGHLLPILITALTHDNLQSLVLADTLIPQVVPLVILTSQVSQMLLHCHQESALTGEDSPTSDGPTSSSFQKDPKGLGYLASLKIPAPWATGKTVECIHPVRDNYKFRETVHIPGARCLFLRFDPRCASQYDYDKVIIYAGPNSSFRKVAEYGGNTYGFGSRSVLGAGWPKDLVKVEGNTVTFTFEMRSGREHNTPDKAMWGFSCTVRAQESSEDSSGGMPFLADLALGLSVLACSMLQRLYKGPGYGQEEEQSRHLLGSKLLQRCVWHPPAMKPVPKSTAAIEVSESNVRRPDHHPILPRIKHSVDIMQRLQRLSGRNAPYHRPSIRDVIQPEALEEAIVSSSLKHLDIEGAVQLLGDGDIPEQQRASYDLLRQVMNGVYRKIYAIQRQLQLLAELEQKWEHDLDSLRCGSIKSNEAFFVAYHQQENKTRELELLTYLRDVDFESANQEDAVKLLREKLEEEASLPVANEPKPQSMLKTRGLVNAILERVELLLHVTISMGHLEVGGHPASLARSASTHPDHQLRGVGFVLDPAGKSASSPSMSRSVSLPVELEHSKQSSSKSVTGSRTQWHLHRRGPLHLLQDMSQGDASHSMDKQAHDLLLEELFSFIGTNLEQAVSLETFLSAARVRWHRGNTRKKALVHIKQLLLAASKVGGAVHLLASVTAVIQNGPRVDELTCGGMVDEVQRDFSETMTSVVTLAGAHPVACANSIGLLCTIPYTRREEQCLVDSGLVQVLDQLCSLGSSSGTSGSTESQTTKQRVSTLAWAGFQVLASRCVSWEADETSHNTFGCTGLARQVSSLLTNHLARATESSGNEAAGSEALQEVLSLLNKLSRSRMGQAILSQPACVSKLLSLLLDQRPSPKLVLIILQLCRVALPLMSAMDCASVQLPYWGQEVSTLLRGGTGGEEEEGGDGGELSDPPFKIASLLLAKLGDYVVPGCQTTASNESPTSTNSDGTPSAAPANGNRDKGEESEAQDGRISVVIHKREDQSSHEVIQPLMSSEGRPFRLGSGANMERVVRMDREMTKYGKADVFTEDANIAIRKATKWAQSGLVVSTGPPVESSNGDPTSGNENGKEKKVMTEVVCREKNAELARTDPVRPFISGHVANSMASEVIALLHSLLTAPETHTALIWASAVERVLSHALTLVTQLTANQTSHVALLTSQSQGEAVTRLMSMCRQVVAAFCALGGFKESIKVGSKVQVTGEGSAPLLGHVISISEPQAVATVEFIIAKDRCIPRANNTLEVPLSRLQPPSRKTLSLQQLSMTERVVSALHSLLIPLSERAMSPLTAQLPAVGDGSSVAMATCRVMAEIRSRACAVMTLHMKEPSFATEFVHQCSLPVEVLKSLAQNCSSGDRVSVIEAQCQRLRMLYRDCARPPPPPAKTTSKMSHDITWSPNRTFPPVRACLFSHNQTAVTFLGDANAGSGLPRGVMCYTTQAVPSQAPSFYWELEICSNGDIADESGPSVSFGFAPPAERKEGAWTNPVGTVLFHNSGRAVHYSGASLLQWKSIRLDVTLNIGDIAGIGWEREGSSPAPGQTSRGSIFLTYNGRRLSATLDGVAGGMLPVVHIQKWNTRVRANFGARPFCYAEGRLHHDAAAEAIDPREEIVANFSVLPFHCDEESRTSGEGGDASVDVPTVGESVGGEATPSGGPPCKLAAPPKPAVEYNSEESIHYKLRPSYNNFTSMGADVRLLSGGSQDNARNSDEDNGENAAGGDPEAQEDYHALLVKAWESKVFPVIRRRFRNEAERRSGLEQIKGALQLGMTDIARQTVEFLYEENGGMPRDLHLPTIDDIKTEAAKFTIEKVRKGTTVVIRQLETAGPSGSTTVPKFAVRVMLKTFGLTGIVLDVDSRQELVQVETYLRSEGVLVRYWYPLDMLERPHAGYRRGLLTGIAALDITNIDIHRELLHCEGTSARMFCRTALMEFLAHCQSPEVIEVIPCSLISGQASASPEQDISHLQLLSNQLLDSPRPDGTLQASSLLMAQCLHQCLASNTRCLADIFYQNTQVLRRELFIAMATAAHMGESRLLELTNQLCGVLETAPTHFPCEVITVTETKMKTDLQFLGAAAVIVSCQQDPKMTRKEASLYQAPWAKVYCYGIGHRVKKSGQTALLEVVSYPADAVINSSAGLSAPPSHNIDPYPTVVLPCQRVHVRLGVSPLPGYAVSLHGLPSEFPLAMAFIETLVGCDYQIGSQRIRGMEDIVIDRVREIPTERQEILKEKPVHIPARVIARAAELLSHYLLVAKVSPLIKEYLFHMLAQLLRTLFKWNPSSETGQVASTLFPLTLIFQLRELNGELRKLYEQESVSAAGRAVSSSSSVVPGQQSSYFQALMELCLALAEVTSEPGLGGQLGASYSGAASKMQLSPQVVAKRKKVKMRRTGASVKRSPRPSESDSGDTATTTSSPGAGSSKPEEMLWFHRALTVSLILRHLIDGDPHGALVTQDAISDAHHSNTIPSMHSRLLVLVGVPPTLEESVVRRAIERACSQHGGLYKQELWIPVQEEKQHPPSDLSDKARADVPDISPGEVSPGTTALPFQAEAVGEGVGEAVGQAACEAVGEAAGEAISATIGEASSETVGEASVEAAGEAASEASSEAASDHVPTKQPPVPDPHEGLLTPPPESDTFPAAQTFDLPGHGKRLVLGYAVLEVRCKAKMDTLENALLNSKELTEGIQVESDAILDASLDEFPAILTVGSNLQMELANNDIFLDYLRSKLLTDALVLKPSAVHTLEQVFYSCLESDYSFRLHLETEEKDSDTTAAEVTLSREQILSLAPGNLLVAFFGEVKDAKRTTQEEVNGALENYGNNRLSLVKPKKPSSKLFKEQPRGVNRRGTKTNKEKFTAAEVYSKSKSLSGTDRKTKRVEKSARDIPEKRQAEDIRAKAAVELASERVLSVGGFVQFVRERALEDATAVWKALMACGFDLHFDRFASLNHTEAPLKSWTRDMDAALVCYVDRLCRKLSITPARLHPHEVYLMEDELANPKFAPLRGVPLVNVRLRFALLQSVSNNLEAYFLPLVDLRPSQTLSLSSAALLARARHILFFDTKVKFFNAILDATAQRNLDQAAPHITLDPLEIVGAEAQDCLATQFCQAARQLATVPSSKLCVKMASGGDPTFAFNVKLTGEEVHGTSGSFRHFLGQVTRELQSSTLGLLVQCPSAGTGRNKGRYLVKPGPITFPEEKLLQFFGQLLGIALRADIPLALDLLPLFWKCLVGVALDPQRDLEEADCVTYDYINSLTEVQSETEFDALCADVSTNRTPDSESPDVEATSFSEHYQPSHNLTFVYNNLVGEEVELCPDGRSRRVSWKSRQQYVSLIREMRLRELACPECMLPIRCGLASVVPIQLLCTMTPYDMELRTCGIMTVDLNFLKAHTMYQVGLVETDAHIQYFWTALEGFSQEEFCRFIKFACNQDRIPCTCPCKDGDADTSHVPPYPMKIAPPDGTTGSPDSRFIRVETCMFMVKLPQYTSQDVMTRRLLYAINCREDPLSG